MALASRNFPDRIRIKCDRYEVCGTIVNDDFLLNKIGKQMLCPSCTNFIKEQKKKQT